MYLASLTQRDRLFDVATRWLIGDVAPGDARFVTEVFLIDHLITRPVIVDLFSDIIGTPPGADVTRVRSKGELRRWMLHAWQRPTPRAASLFSSYDTHSAQYFPTTPFDGLVLEEPRLDMAASIRFKSLSRIVEKAARHARQRIEAECRLLSHEEPVSPTQCADLEQQVCEAFEERRLVFTTADLFVQDVIGVKLIASDGRLDWFEKTISSRAESSVVERSEHRGQYNDRQLIIRLPAPDAGPTIDRLRSIDWSGAASRGIDPESLRRAIPAYVESGSRAISLEIILTTWEDFVESEFGRSIHEERVLRQRSSMMSNGHVATTIVLSLLYLLLIAISPAIEAHEVPVRLTGRYLPETTVGMIAKLFGITIATSPFWTEDVAVLPGRAPERSLRR